MRPLSGTSIGPQNGMKIVVVEEKKLMLII